MIPASAFLQVGDQAETILLHEWPMAIVLYTPFMIVPSELTTDPVA